MITKGQKNLFTNTLIIMLLACAVSQVLFSFFFETYNFPGRIISICFIWVVTCASCYWLTKTVTGKPKAFSRVFMLQTAIKLLLYMACVLAYLTLYRQYAIPFTVQFLCVYLIFAIFEAVSVLKFVNANPGQMPGSIKTSN